MVGYSGSCLVVLMVVTKALKKEQSTVQLMVDWWVALKVWQMVDLWAVQRVVMKEDLLVVMMVRNLVVTMALLLADKSAAQKSCLWAY